MGCFVTKEIIKSDIEIATNFLGVPYTSISINNDTDNDNDSKEDIPENKYDNFDLVTEKDLEYMCNNDSYICITYSVSKDIQGYLNRNEVVYDKKQMNGKYQVGSGRIVAVTHDTPFIDDIVTQDGGKSQEKNPSLYARTRLITTEKPNNSSGTD